MYINATFVATVFVETKHGEKGKESGDAVLPLSLPEKKQVQCKSLVPQNVMPAFSNQISSPPF